MPDTFTPDQFSQIQQISLKSVDGPLARRLSSSGLTWAPADQAYVVMRGWPAAKRLILLTRGEAGYRHPVRLDTTNMSKKEVNSLVSKLNHELGVRRAAAKALALDWQYEYRERPLPPTTVADYLRGEEAMRAAYGGRFYSSQAAPAGWLYVKATTNYYNVRLWPTELRFVQLTSIHETNWASAHGRGTPNKMLPSERAAERFNNFGSKLSLFQHAYNERYSSEYAMNSKKMKDLESYNRVKLADQEERRKALLALRQDRHPLLQGQIEARAAYVAARSMIFASSILQSGKA